MKRWGLMLVALFLAPILVACGQTTQAEDRLDQSTPSLQEQIRGAVIVPPRQIEDFTLPSTDGEFRFSDLRGKLVLIYFGYMTCPDVCPTSGAHLKRVYEEINRPDDLAVVFVTVDPERDTLDRLRPYIKLFNEDFVALRGEGDALQEVFTQFGVVAIRRQVGESALSYLMDHTASIFLVNQEGLLISQFIFGLGADDILHDVELLLE
ncbi:SCO1 protein [Anaerolineae bacterium]|nr:SCO1 protein [Anaerolineae bacterium]